MGKEHALVISNHRSDIDWLVGWVIAQILGWSMWFAGYISLERSWAKDENKLKSGFRELNNFHQPFWLAVFVEGTRFTQTKLLAAQEYAASTGLPMPRNVLIPRTKGFVAAVSHLRTFVPAVYNITFAIPKDKPRPTLLRMLRGCSSVVHVRVERHLMQELPEDASGIAQWCKDVFVVKDALLEGHLAMGTFVDQEFQDIGRPKRSLLILSFSSSDWFSFTCTRELPSLDQFWKNDQKRCNWEKSGLKLQRGPRDLIRREEKEEETKMEKERLADSPAIAGKQCKSVAIATAKGSHWNSVAIAGKCKSLAIAGVLQAALTRRLTDSFYFYLICVFFLVVYNPLILTCLENKFTSYKLVVSK